MKTYKVFQQRTEIEYAEIEAESMEEAEELADTNSDEYYWKTCDGTMSVTVLINESEEL